MLHILIHMLSHMLSHMLLHMLSCMTPHMSPCISLHVSLHMPLHMPLHMLLHVSLHLLTYGCICCSLSTTTAVLVAIHGLPTLFRSVHQPVRKLILTSLWQTYLLCILQTLPSCYVPWVDISSSVLYDNLHTFHCCADLLQQLCWPRQSHRPSPASLLRS